MSFLAPTTALMAAAVTVPSLVLLYFLKLRRRKFTVSSTLLWRKAIQDQQVNAPFQRLRRNLLLLIQLLILGCLLLALGRPTLRTTAHRGQRVVILVDHSASMSATDVAPTRLGYAKRAALDLVNHLAGSEGSSTDAAASGVGAMVISVAQRARVVQPFTTDPVLLRRAVNAIEPTDEPTHLADALKLVEPFAHHAAAQGSDGEAASLIVYVISDGRYQDELPGALGAAEARFIQVGTPTAHNIAITSLTARRHLTKPQWVQVYAEVAGCNAEPVETTLTLKVAGRTLNVTPITVPPAPPPTDVRSDRSSIKAIKFDLPLLDTALLELSHDYEDDLKADDTARLVVAPPRRLRILLVTAGNAFLQHAIEAASPRKLVLMTPKRYEDQDPDHLRRGVGEGGFDAIVFDRHSPSQVPPVSAVYFAATPPIPGLQRIANVSGDNRRSAQFLLDWNRNHALLRYVAIDDLLTTDPARLALPDHARSLATSQAGPVIAAIPAGPTRHVVVAFDLLKTNWPMHISFPVFIGNALGYLGLTGSAHEGLAFLTGTTAVLPISASRSLTYQGPQPLTPQSDPTTRSVILAPFRRAGLYTASADVGEPWNHLAVNLTNAVESDLRPGTQLDIGSTPAAANAAASLVRREVWAYFAAAALALLMVEWVVYTRRMHL